MSRHKVTYDIRSYHAMEFCHNMLYVMTIAASINKRSALIGYKTREIWPNKFLPYISYGEYSFVVLVLTNCRQLLLYISNDKNHLYKFVTSKTFLVAITRAR